MEGRFLYTDSGFSSESSENQHATTTYINLPRDLALANRKNFTMTSKKGVPLVYHCKVTIFRAMEDDAKVMMNSYILTAQKNWVTRNASVKLHYGRENMFKKAGIRRSERGRYDKTLRLVYDNAGQTWAVPTFNDASASYTATGSEWDNTVIAIDEDTSLVPALFGSIVDESSTVSASTFNIQNAYLNSRRKVPVDDLEVAESSQSHSIIRSLFTTEIPAVETAVSDLADSNQDETPYNSDAAAGTFTSAAIAGAVQIGNISTTGGTMYVDIPFGIFGLINNKQTTDDGVASMEGNITILLEVLGFSELEG